MQHEENFSATNKCKSLKRMNKREQIKEIKYFLHWSIKNACSTKFTFNSKTLNQITRFCLCFHIELKGDWDLIT